MKSYFNFIKRSSLFILLLLSLVNCYQAQSSATTQAEYVPFLENGKWGLADWEGKVIFEAQWDKSLTERVQSMHEYGLYSFLNEQGIYVVHGPSKSIHGPFVQVRRTWAKGLNCRVENKMGFIGADGMLAIPIEFRDIYSNRYNERLLLMNSSGKQGFTQIGEPLPTEFPYEKMQSITFHGDESGAYLGSKDGKWGMLSFDEKELIPFEYGELKKLGSTSRPIYLLGIKSLADNKVQADLYSPEGKLLFSKSNTRIEVLTAQLIKVFEEGKGVQLVNAAAQPISTEYFSVSNWLPARDVDAPQILSAETVLGKKMYFDGAGNPIPNEEAEAQIEAHKNTHPLPHLDIVEVNKLKGVINSQNGDTILPAKFQHVKFIGECLSASQYTDPSNIQISLFDQKGKVLVHDAKRIRSIYIDYSSSSFPLLEIKNGSKTTYRHPSGQEILDSSFEEIKPELVRDDASNDPIPLLKVKKNGKWGYVDLEGKPILDTKYDEVKSLIGNRLFLVRLDEKQFVVNTHGKVYPAI